MRTVLVVLALAAPAAGVAALWSPGEPDPDPPTEAAAEASGGDPAAGGGRGLLARATPRPAPSARPEPPPDPAHADWEAALVASKEGKPREAFSLAKRARAKSPAFFRDKGRLAKWKALEAAAASAEAALAALRLAALERAAGDPESDRRLTREERESLNATFAKMVDVIADAQTPEERAALLRHARRFLLPPSSFRGDVVSSRLAAIERARKKSAGEPLPADDDEIVEARRVDQLERLRQRDLVSLLDRIHAALAWLALHQADDGRFSDAAVRERCGKLGHAPCLPEGNDGYAVATTALAVCAFLDFRDQDALGLFEPTLARGIAWLLKRQAADGSFPGGGQTYTSAVALMALAQAAGSTGRADVREAVGRGLAWFASIQHPDGGFRYRKRQPGDLSATGWAAQAVAAARASGLAVPASIEEGIGRFLTSVWIGDHRFGYLDSRRESGSLGPVGMLTGLLVWKDLPNSTLGAWRGHLQQSTRGRALYWVYYAVRVDLAVEGGLSPALRKSIDDLVAKQSTKGDTSGAFSGRLDPWLVRGGTSLQTAVVALTLEHALFLR